MAGDPDREVANATDEGSVDRAVGCLLGLGCGDALGGPVEFVTREVIAARYPGGLRDFVGGGWLDLRPGEATDDTQMTFALARALSVGGLDHDRLAEEFVAWYRSEPKDIGNTTRAALTALAAGTPWHEAGHAALTGMPVGSGASNGAVMRCAPVAIRFRDEPEWLVAASLDSARITHAEPRAAWAAVAVNQAIVHLLLGGGIGDAPAAAVAGIPEAGVVDVILGAGDRPRALVRGTGFVLDTLAAAFWAVRTTSSAEDCVVAAVALGDDADTSGAVAGALAGAHYGAGSLPCRWLDLLEARQELTSEARRLARLSTRTHAE